LNTAVEGLARAWEARDGVTIRHIVGARDFDAEADGSWPPVGDAHGLHYQRVRFEDRMALCYAAADVAVHRAGASTVAELAATGVPSILVPLPGAPGDHQTANARRLADAGAAVLLPDDRLDADTLAEELDALLGDSLRLRSMSVAARNLARPHAAAEVAALAERYALEDRA
jgi:UDP-N-acetylglucosamine--N-acetylmuramyl-(pentapeptide) pyrophosphoryl-undecaprenol N-acetylglucosamine transferase